MRERKPDATRPTKRPGASQRQLRVGEELRHALAQLFQRGALRDPALRDLNLTVTEVRLSPDLKHATAFVMPLGGHNASEAIAGLRRSAAYLRMELARAVKLRIAPTIAFELDASFDHASKVGALLHRPEVARDLTQEGTDDGA